MTPAQVRVGLISDTHGQCRPSVLPIFANVDFIVHAGDVGGHTVLTWLATVARVEAVSGNVDDRHDPDLPRERTLPVGDLTLHVSHGDELGRPRAAALLARYPADILVYGHTHRSLLHYAEGGRVVVNPGAAGPRRFNVEPRVAVLTVSGRAASVEFFEIE